MEITAQPITTTHYTITITDAEAGEFLVDPAPLQAKVRAVRNAQSVGKHGPSNFAMGKALRANKPTKDEKPAPKALVSKERVPCPECGALYLKAGLNLHISRSHRNGKATAGSAA